MAEQMTPEELNQYQAREFTQKIDEILSPVFDEIVKVVKEEAALGIQLQQAATVVAVSSVYWAGYFEGICAHAVKMHADDGGDVDFMVVGDYVTKLMKEARRRGFTDGTEAPLRMSPIGTA